MLPLQRVFIVVVYIYIYIEITSIHSSVLLMNSSLLIMGQWNASFLVILNDIDCRAYSVGTISERNYNNIVPKTQLKLRQ